MPKKRKRKKSAKRVARGKKLARALPRDASGKFLPRGSKNLFRKRKRAAKRRTTKPKAMTKRRRTARTAGALTKDLFPNFMSGRVPVPGAIISNFVTTRVQTPIPRLKVTGNRATVMELLWVDVVFRGAFPDGSGNEIIFTMTIGTPPDGGVAANFDRPTTFAMVRWLAIGTGSSTNTQPFRYKFETQEGYGYLLASDAFNVNVQTGLIQGASDANWKLFYRFVDIPLNEFIGIVQSTQQV